MGRAPGGYLVKKAAFPCLQKVVLVKEAELFDLNLTFLGFFKPQNPSKTQKAFTVAEEEKLPVFDRLSNL